MTRTILNCLSSHSQLLTMSFDHILHLISFIVGTVGLMTLPILGAAEGFTEEQASEPAIALGTTAHTAQHPP